MLLWCDSSANKWDLLCLSPQRLHHAVLSEQWHQLCGRICHLLCAGFHGIWAKCSHWGCGRIWYEKNKPVLLEIGKICGHTFTHWYWWRPMVQVSKYNRKYNKNAKTNGNKNMLPLVTWQNLTNMGVSCKLQAPALQSLLSTMVGCSGSSHPCSGPGKANSKQQQSLSRPIGTWSSSRNSS